MIFAPSLKVLPRHVGGDNLAATTQRNVETTFRQERLELGIGHSDSRFNDPVRDDFGDSSVTRHENVVVFVQSLFGEIQVLREKVSFGFDDFQIRLDVFDD